MVAGDSALIIQNKGGGHGEIGYHLALQLVMDRGFSVTILHEGPNKGKPPHNSYSDLEAAGVNVIWCDDLADADVCIGALNGATFSAVIDNWSKSPEAIRPYAELAKEWEVNNYAFISSAGMYTPPKGDFSAISEDCDVKSSGQRQAEVFIAELGLPFTCFRPQYIYGPKQGKSYLGYFFDRATRDRSIPVPNDGSQMVTMTHAADNAAMVAAAVDNPAAVGEVFNCATSSLISYRELALLCAEAAGNTVSIASYDPKAFELPKGFFPFRDAPFFVSAEKAQKLLGFEPKNFIKDDIKWYYQNNYKAAGGLSKEVDFAFDDVVLGK
eukprot:CAMPEP_0119335178 /NCGR_PEP_ID=MMETSP1333-20130426/88912_1 /TAXON_ID=418940 /ORGANISM="Scyphosphaera apsteinii, Strain RCC1455" /LENGTH=325 /DNA_ID=CAMNT_0007345659 /DNA_START=139 /DNA_END=1116 /DNA_ORIENTATION=-